MVQVHSQCETLHVSFPDVAQSINYTTSSPPAISSWPNSSQRKGRPQNSATDTQTAQNTQLFLNAMELQEEVHSFSVLMIVFRVILSITGLCFVLQTEVLGAGKHTNHGHNGDGGRL